MNNIVAFPKSKKEIPPQSLEELFAKVEETKREHVDYLVDDVFSGLFPYLYMEGFDLTRDGCEKTTTLFTESFKAALLKSVMIDHPLHEVAEDLCEDESEEDLDDTCGS